MKKRDPRLYVEDILEAIDAIERYTKGLSKEEFFQNDLVQDGVMRRLEIIGEAARQLSKEMPSLSRAIPWRRITGFRNILAHEYFGVVLDRVWNVVHEDLPPLKVQLEEVRNHLG